jgi:ribonuclease HI
MLQCRNSLQQLSIHNRVQLFWVPGHCGIIGNEETDDLAGVGSKSNSLFSRPKLTDDTCGKKMVVR